MAHRHIVYFIVDGAGSVGDELIPGNELDERLAECIEQHHGGYCGFVCGIRLYAPGRR
jgi:hypothetical protein